MATESMALCEAVEHGEYVGACLSELLQPDFDFRQWERATRRIPLCAGTDCKSVFDHVSLERGLPRDRILALDLAALRATFESQLREDAEGRNAKLYWLPGPRNLADGLTKFISLQSLIISTLSSGTYTLADEHTLMQHAAAMRDRLKSHNRNHALVLFQ